MPFTLSRRAALGLVASLLLHSPLLVADDALQRYDFQRDELRAAVQSVVAERFPEAEPRILGESHGVVVFEVADTGLSPSPRLFVFGGAVGRIGYPETRTGTRETYEIPQMALLFALDESDDLPVQCGYALFEPTFRHGRLRFGGLLRVDWGNRDEWTCLCGIVEGAADRHALDEESASDGLDEVQVRLAVRDLRADPESPPVHPGVCVVDLQGRDPLVLEQRLEESSTDLPPVWLELSGVDEVAIRVRPRREDRRPDLPAELSHWREKFPDLVLEEVERKDGGVVLLRGLVREEYDFAHMMRDLQKKPDTGNVMPSYIRPSAGGAGYEFSMTYVHGQQGEQGEKP